MDLRQNWLFRLSLSLLSLLSSFPLAHSNFDRRLGVPIISCQSRGRHDQLLLKTFSRCSGFSQRQSQFFVSHPPSTPSTMYRSILRQVGHCALSVAFFCPLSPLPSLPLHPGSLSCQVGLHLRHQNSQPSRRDWLPLFPKKSRMYVPAFCVCFR